MPNFPNAKYPSKARTMMAATAIRIFFRPPDPSESSSSSAPNDGASDKEPNVGIEGAAGATSSVELAGDAVTGDATTGAALADGELAACGATVSCCGAGIAGASFAGAAAAADAVGAGNVEFEVWTGANALANPADCGLIASYLTMSFPLSFAFGACVAGVGAIGAGRSDGAGTDGSAAIDTGGGGTGAAGCTSAFAEAAIVGSTAGSTAGGAEGIAGSGVSK